MADSFFPEDDFKVELREELSGTGSLRARYGVPPFSVLDARSGEWKAKKAKWLDLGIKSELGRGDNLLTTGAHSVFDGTSNWSGVRSGRVCPGGSLMPASKRGADGKTVRGDSIGKPLAARTFRCGGPQGLKDRYDQGEEFDLEDIPDGQSGSGTGTSIFDPYLCEILYRWFTPRGGSILDPFAGGSVRGIVANMLGYQYTGIDLRPEQLESNRQQALEIVPQNQPTWILGDSLNIHKLVPEGVLYDSILTCPPYHDLERYCDDTRDLSNMTWAEFLDFYGKIIKRTLSLLKPNRFACVVIGDVRDMREKKDHFYKNLPGKTIDLFQEAGAGLYNQAILITAGGSLSIRAKFQFPKSRKLGNTHQHVLVFCKGDWREAVKAVNDSLPPGEAEPGILTENEGEE